MKLNREQFLVAAMALATSAGGCKLGSKGDDLATQAGPENPQGQVQGAPAVAPAPPGANPTDDPEGNSARDQAGAGERGTPTAAGTPTSAGTTKGFVTGTTKGVSPTKEVGVSPTKEVGVSPTKEVGVSPTNEYGKKVPPPPPTKEK